jgi:serine/threonine-protein kinase
VVSKGPNAPAAVLEAGDRVGPYRIEALLGEGGMGQVFRATRQPDGAVVALKVVKAALAGDAELTRRFQRETKAAATVQHRHLIGVLDAGEDDGRHYIAMPLVSGRTLDARIEAEGPLPIADAIQLTCEVAAGLDALHGAGVVHRDIKPSNIMLDESGMAALTDFGLAKGERFSTITRTGQVLGTLDYMAPELIRGDDPGPPSDIYALGCVVFQCLAGAPPFAHRSIFQVGLGHLEEEPPDPCAGRADAPTGFSEIVLQALAKDPVRRPPTAVAYSRLLSVAGPAGGG